MTTSIGCGGVGREPGAREAERTCRSDSLGGGCFQGRSRPARGMVELIHGCEKGTDSRKYFSRKERVFSLLMKTPGQIKSIQLASCLRTYNMRDKKINIEIPMQGHEV